MMLSNGKVAPMPLTDKEIVKALECCISGIPCYKTKCPFKIKEICGDDIKALEKYALDLINRLQAEVNHLDNESDALLADIDFRDKEINELQAQNERLKEGADSLFNTLDYRLEQILKLQDNLNTAKAEAYKEFAERVKLRFSGTLSCSGGVIKIAVNNLLKELVGEENG